MPNLITDEVPFFCMQVSRLVLTLSPCMSTPFTAPAFTQNCPLSLTIICKNIQMQPQMYPNLTQIGLIRKD